MTAEVQEQVWDEANWSVWKVDLIAGTAAPFDALEVPSFAWDLARASAVARGFFVP